MLARIRKYFHRTPRVTIHIVSEPLTHENVDVITRAIANRERQRGRNF